MPRWPFQHLTRRKTSHPPLLVVPLCPGREGLAASGDGGLIAPVDSSSSVKISGTAFQQLPAGREFHAE